ncbi:fusion of 3-hydroxyacyl-CoA dehydrogenase and enoyl-CoA hydratase [Azoarcus sp. CIB]|uniref:3-hydroxyacyl-CoA dehydrogenase/enoyl-CoA hydratase family protein n=1 Tax=Aromatoleum sp. (strain CIB) TaxID=198107 RepID=UPI00067E4F7A|nr:3-hydroxyacyl-CoA dehydrogenase/enoyl-CoA hydratase family protein [Azoarcus sp. CIB]AKU11673.1 fusion of 3-hydroxyacyl-CoA dehydrogenase and enoyl-CoA hydratase [Azoarcus sp. CIB]
MVTRFANPLLATPQRPLPRTVAIIGAGTIGPDIGYYLKSALPDLKLILVDVAQAALDRALQRFAEYAAKAVAKGKMSEAEAAAVTTGVVGTLDYRDLAEADWVLEAATENLALKRRIFADVEAVVRADTLITSNTSSLPAAQIFSDLKHPQRATVTHFFAPAWRNPVVEVVRWARTDPAVVEYLRWAFCTTGKVPLVTDDVACFMLDRIFDNWCNESGLLLDRATAAEIDSVAGEFVHAGPFFVLNLANGNPIITETNTLQAELEGEHYEPAPVFRSVDRWLTVPPGKPVKVADDTAATVRERLLGVLFSQTVDILDRDIGEPADLDFGCRQALGFRKGPLELMRDLGDTDAGRMLARFCSERRGMPAARKPLGDYQGFLRHVLVDDIGDVKVITLRRPEALNALHDQLTDEILSVIRRFEHDPAVAGFVLVGYGNRAFCAGGDIGRFVNMLGDAPASAQYARDCSRLLVHLDRMKKPVVAAINGMALGGGFELAMRCHGIVALASAWMQMPEITLGIVHGIGAMVVPYRRWPQASAEFHGMLRRAERLKATKAFELGVVDGLARDYPELIHAAVARVKALDGKVGGIPDGAVQIARLDPIAPVAASGQPLSAEVIDILERAVEAAAAAPTFEEALEIGYLAWGDSACTAAAREGISAFQEKRKPDFTKTP